MQNTAAKIKQLQTIIDSGKSTKSQKNKYAKLILNNTRAKLINRLQEY